MDVGERPGRLCSANTACVGWPGVIAVRKALGKSSGPFLDFAGRWRCLALPICETNRVPRGDPEENTRNARHVRATQVALRQGIAALRSYCPVRDCLTRASRIPIGAAPFPRISASPGLSRSSSVRGSIASLYFCCLNNSSTKHGKHLSPPPRSPDWRSAFGADAKKRRGHSLG